MVVELNDEQKAIISFALGIYLASIPKDKIAKAAKQISEILQKLDTSE